MDPTDDPELRRITRFWDARAREDALRYSVPGGTRVDDATFAGAGHAVLDALEQGLGWTAEGAGLAVDIGCGAGRVTDAIADRAEEVAAVDVSPRMIDAARERVAGTLNVDWHVAEAGDLGPVPSGRAGAALLLGVLPHLPTVKHVAAALDEVGRILRPGGAVAFDVRSGTPPLVLPGEDDLPVHVTGHPLWRGVVVDLETVAALAHQSGLVVERIDGSGSARCLVLARREQD